MSKRTHEQQSARARQKRENDRLETRKKRSQIVVITMVILLVLSLVGAALAGLVGGSSAPVEDDDVAEFDEQAGPPDDIEPCPPAEDVPEPTDEQFDEPPELRIDGDAEVTATFETTCGDIVVELLPDAAPIAVGNFVTLALEDFFDGTPFHRTQWDFVIQGGDPSGDGTGGPGYEIPDELELADSFEPFGEQLVAYPRGTLAMANRGPDTAGSQFFIVQADPDYPFPPLYTVFGRVLEGMDVVDRIAAGEEQGSIAVEPVIVTDVRIDGLPDDVEDDAAGGTDDDADADGEDDADEDADADDEDGEADGDE